MDRSETRRRLDARFADLRELKQVARPHRGWVRAVRDALGMTRSQMADRMGVAPTTLVDLEQNEVTGSIQLSTLRRAADAMDCDLVYVLVPRTSLEETVQAQARRKATAHLARISHQGRLENQELPDTVRESQITELSAKFVDRRGLWATDDG